MKTIEIPEINNVYYTLSELIDLFQTLKLIRFIQERYKRERKSSLLEYYNNLQVELTKKIEKVNSFCTPLEYLSGYIQNRLEDCKRIELIENRTLSIKQSIHEVCKRHYPNMNNSSILNKLCLNNIEGKYKSFNMITLNNTISVDCTNHIGDIKCFHFTKNYILGYVSWKLANGKEMFKSFKQIHDLTGSFKAVL